jgi:hypothetical protein
MSSGETRVRVRVEEVGVVSRIVRDRALSMRFSPTLRISEPFSQEIWFGPAGCG